ncbi:hypothetical protein QBC34DRAFT_387688 [Podospora aff. communis PSN243]|uniref:Rhodopsin domain-containing protein n=1 Tax=Podospora aff. communis PSN243 TaxID=3040156 RepID=A0AAV9FZD1_9PEZI|nr:hypothetical protein QBC34DRAFT_387688 [Podospora aff. communis PSN243]
MDPLQLPPSPPIDPNLGIKSTIWILTTLSALFLALRLHCRRRGSGLHWDDAILAAAWTALLSYVVIVTIILDKTAPPQQQHQLTNTQPSPTAPVKIKLDDISTIATLGLTSMTLAITAQSWSKTSFAVTLLRIAPPGGGSCWTRRFLWFAIGSMNVLFGLRALLLWVGCAPLEKAWRPMVKGRCWDAEVDVVLGIAVSAYSGVMDIVLTFIPWIIILPLNMKPREKWGCVIAMSMGIFAAIATFIKCSKIPLLGGGGTRQFLQLTIWGVIEPAVTIMGASVPAMRALLRNSAAKRRRLSQDKEEGGYELKTHPVAESGPNNSTVATWGSILSNWASTVATWGSAAASRVSRP